MASSETLQERRLRKTKSGLRLVTKNGAEASPFLLDEPPWIPDIEVAVCEKCEKRFDFFSRRHHCRRCGRIFCDKDCNRKIPLPRFCFVDPVRLCDPCADVTDKENIFFDKHLKTLTAGTFFNVCSTKLRSDSKSGTDMGSGYVGFYCRLTSNQRYIEFQHSTVTHPGIDITSIDKVQILTTSVGSGSPSIGGIAIDYRDNANMEHTVTFKSDPDSNRKQSLSWLSAMQKAMKMLFESKTAS